MDLWSFWALSDARPQDEATAIERYAEIFEDSVKLHKRSDVPIAVFLSGGIDSTSILCSLARSQEAVAVEDRKRLKALAFMDPRFDESRFINDTIGQTSAELQRVVYTAEDVWVDLPKVLWHHDQPVHSTTALIGYRLSQVAAANGIKVILNGQGADETAAGYRHYFNGYWQTVLAASGPGALLRELKSYAKYWGGNPISELARVLCRAFTAQPYRLQGYRNLRKHLAIKQDRLHSWFTPELLDRLLPPPQGQLDRFYLNCQLRHAVERSPLPLYLRIEDRNSMAHSVEVRVPFLDYRLVDLLFSLPGEHKMRGPYNKYIIREAMRGKIPRSVRERQDKMGFPSPSGAWMSELQTNIRDTFNSRFARELGILNLKQIMIDFERSCRGERQLGRELFNILQFLIWYRNIGDAAI
jgi:asparagine synthase (glutamine-hydrolysing)